MISQMPMKFEAVESLEPGFKYIVGTYQEYARTNHLDAIDVALVARGIANYCLVEGAAFYIDIGVWGYPTHRGSENNVGTIGHSCVPIEDGENLLTACN